MSTAFTGEGGLAHPANALRKRKIKTLSMHPHIHTGVMTVAVPASDAARWHGHMQGHEPRRDDA